MVALDRRELNEKVVKGSEILEVLHSCPEVKKYLFSLYDCQYAEFFQVSNILSVGLSHAHTMSYANVMYGVAVGSRKN